MKRKAKQADDHTAKLLKNADVQRGDRLKKAWMAEQKKDRTRVHVHS